MVPRVTANDDQLNGQIVQQKIIDHLSVPAKHVLRLLATITMIRSIAIGGSQAEQKPDLWSDVDFFVFCNDTDLGAVVNSVNNGLTLDLAFPRQVIPARMSPRFGIKHTVIPAQSNSIEVFVNAPCIFAPLPMTNTMRFINGQARTFFIESFPRYVPNDDGSLARLITSASLEVVAEIRSFAKARSRGQLGVALYYYNRIKTILLALRQHAFDKAYDPHSIERRPLPPSLQPLNTLLDELNSSSVHPFTICDQLYVLLLESVGNLTANCTALDELESWTNLERDRLRRLLAE